MSGTATPSPIGAGATQKLAGTRTGWAHTLTTKVGDILTVEILERPNEEHDSRWVGTKLGHPPLVRFRATLPGWHRVRVGLDPRGQMHAAVTHEGCMLKAPERPDHERDVHLFWLDPDDEPERRTAARELARYFILGWTKVEESTMARELHRRTDDVYPELSEIGLEHEMLLTQLAEAPERLDGDEWDELEDCGRRVMEVLDRPPA